MKAVVNQRVIAASEIAFIPLAFTVSMRSFHIDCGPIRAAVCEHQLVDHDDVPTLNSHFFKRQRRSADRKYLRAIVDHFGKNPTKI